MVSRPSTVLHSLVHSRHASVASAGRHHPVPVSFRPRGLSPPRRFAPWLRSLVCCTQQPVMGFTTFRASARRLPRTGSCVPDPPGRAHTLRSLTRRQPRHVAVAMAPLTLHPHRRPDPPVRRASERDDDDTLIQVARTPASGRLHNPDAPRSASVPGEPGRSRAGDTTGEPADATPRDVCNLLPKPVRVRTLSRRDLGVLACGALLRLRA